MTLPSRGRAHWCAFFFALLALGLFVSPSGASTVPSARVAGVVSATPPPVTGSFADLAAPSWTAAFHARDFENLTTRVPAAEPTDAALVFGPDAVYAAFVMTQRTAKIVAQQTQNGQGLGLDDYVGLAFDTSGNGTNQYFFEVTPLGIRHQSDTESTRYDPAWTAYGARENGRWLAEFVIPYRFLRGGAGLWRVNFTRWIAADRVVQTWAYESAMTTPDDPTEWPSIAPSPNLAGRVRPATAQVYGLASLGRDRRVFESAAGEFSRAQSRDVGIDLKLPLTTGLNLDVTLDPDDSNLESDQQVIAPQEFAYQYAEYRPFFTQGANDLPGSDVFYSPTIGIFSHGEKLEGQAGDFAVGALDVGTSGTDDRAYDVTYASGDRELSLSLSGAHARRLAGGDQVDEAGFFDTNLHSKIGFGGGTARERGAFTTDPARAVETYADAQITKPNYSIAAAYYDLGPEYHPLDAYIGTTDIRGPQVSASLSSTTNARAAIRFATASLYLDRYLDRSGAVREADDVASAGVTLHDLLGLTLTQNLSSLRAYPRTYPDYSGGITTAYDQDRIAIGYRTGEPDTASVSYAWGPYAGFDLQQTNVSISHEFSSRYTAEIDDGRVLERGRSASNGQILRRYLLTGTLSPDESLGAAYRVISGTGGFASPGRNLALDYRRRDRKGDVLQVEVGSPAASQTLDRVVVKYVLLVGSGAGE